MLSSCIPDYTACRSA